MSWLNAFRRRGTGGPVVVRARLEGAMSQRRLRGWQPPLENINSLVASGGPRLLARSRELVDIFRRGCDATFRRLLARSRELVGNCVCRLIRRFCVCWRARASWW